MTETLDTKTQETPGGSIPEYKLWQHRVDQGSGQEKVYVDSEGKSHKLQDGERFSVKLDRAANRYDAVVTGKDGKERTVGSGPLNRQEPVTTTSEKQQQSSLRLDKDRLNHIVRISTASGQKRFGLELVLTPEDKSSVSEIANTIHQEVSQAIAGDPQWIEFKNLGATLNGKGMLSTAEFPPTWLKNGGPNAPVAQGEEYSNLVNDKGGGNRTTITVPERIFHAYYWLGVADNLEKSLVFSNSRGTDSGMFGRELVEAAHYLRSTGRL